MKKKILILAVLAAAAAATAYVIRRRKAAKNKNNTDMKYFTLAELTASATAASLGIDNTPSPEAEQNLAALVAAVLDPLREAYGAPLYVNSGYRCPELNAAVGGVATSQHLYGQAADIDTRRGTAANRRLAALAQSLRLPFDQLIIENNGQWLHLSHRPDGRNRRQCIGATRE